MDLYTKLLKPLLFKLDAERAHTLAFWGMGLGDGALLPYISKAAEQPAATAGTIERPIVVAGMQFRNRIGLAAGFDKNALLVQHWHKLGFGHVEIGTVTPRPQAGNPKPRLFRLPTDQGLINRMGFNNDGAETIRKRLELNRPDSDVLIVGGNIGKNKETSEEDAFRDYLICLEALHEVVDYFTVNISSPNTKDLRNLQKREALWRLLGNLQERNQKFGHPRPIFIKVAPDLNNIELGDIALVAQETACSGIVATNTTIGRTGLSTPLLAVNEMGAGGLSGLPLVEQGYHCTQLFGKLMQPPMALISSGGIMDAREVGKRIDAGADLVQLYTGFVYHGPALVQQALEVAADPRRKTKE